MAALILAIAYLPTILGWFDNHHPSARTLSALAFILTVLAGPVVTIAGWQATTRLGRDPDPFGLIMSLAVPLVPTALVYFLYPS